MSMISLSGKELKGIVGGVTVQDVYGFVVNNPSHSGNEYVVPILNKDKDKIVTYYINATLFDYIRDNETKVVTAAKKSVNMAKSDDNKIDNLLKSANALVDPSVTLFAVSTIPASF